MARATPNLSAHIAATTIAEFRGYMFIDQSLHVVQDEQDLL